jgi:hypothetical protein
MGSLDRYSGMYLFFSTLYSTVSLFASMVAGELLVGLYGIAQCSILHVLIQEL